MPSTQNPTPECTQAGIGLRATHYDDMLEQLPEVGFLEVHPENYLGGGRNRHLLLQLRKHYPVSFHSVGMSLGSDDLPNKEYLLELKGLADEVQPFHFSDHVSWSATGNAHLNDLLPLPYNEETLERLSRNVDHAQTILKRPLLVENPSTYLTFTHSTMSEGEFLNRLCVNTGCSLLLDVNNIVVSAHNHHYDANAFLKEIKPSAVRQFHLSGHTEREFAEGKAKLKIDTHDQYVSDEVWKLYAAAVSRFGPQPTLIEWDANLPPLEDLVAEAKKADEITAKAERKEPVHEAA